MPAKAATVWLGTLNHISSRPAFGLGSAKAVNGTRQRCSGFASIERQNGLARLRTLVMRFVMVVPSRFPGKVNGTPHCIESMNAPSLSCLTIKACRFGQASAGVDCNSGGKGRFSDQPTYSRHVCRLFCYQKAHLNDGDVVVDVEKYSQIVGLCADEEVSIRFSMARTAPSSEWLDMHYGGSYLSCIGEVLSTPDSDQYWHIEPIMIGRVYTRRPQN